MVKVTRAPFIHNSHLSSLMSSTPILFVIVGKNEPLFEAEIDTSTGSSPNQNDLSTRQNYFVLHSALDLVEKSAYTTTNMYLRVVDKVNHQQVSTFLTAANVKFMLLHGGKGEEVVKNFFNEVYGYYVKHSTNPFYKYDTPITSKAFDARVRAAAKAYLS